MIEIFRKNIFINSLLLLPYVCLLRIHSLFEPQAYIPTEMDSPLSVFFYDLIGTSPLLHSIFAIIFVFLQAVFVNRLVIMNRLENETSLLSGVFYVILASAISDFLVLSPLLIGTTFILFGLTELFQTYKKAKSEHLIFSSGFWIGVASLFYLPYLLFFLVILVGLMILRSVKISEWFQMFTGLCIPFFLFGTILFWRDSLPELWDQFANNFGFFEKIRGLTGKEMISFLSLALLIVFSVISYVTITSRKSIQISKKIDILYWGLLLCLFSFGLTQPDALWGLQIIAFPLCVFVAFLFQKIQNKMFAEIAHLVLITLLIIGHFQF